MPNQTLNCYQATLEKIGMNSDEFNTKISNLDGCLEVMGLIRQKGADIFRNALWLRAEMEYQKIFLNNGFNEEDVLKFQKQYSLITDGPDLGWHFGKTRFYHNIPAVRCDQEYRLSAKYYSKTKRI